MIRPSWKCLVFSVVLIGACTVLTSEASAHWWGWSCCAPVTYSYSSCCSPCYSCCDSYVGSSGWGLGWRPGPIRRLLFGRYRWYPTSWASPGYYTYAAWEPCCGDGTVISSGAASPTMPGTTTVVPQTSKPTLAPQKPASPGPSKSLEEEMKLLPDSAPATPKKTSNPSTQDSRSRGESGLLSVNVPGAAKVYINGRETKAAGSYREFVSFGLQEGKIYPYTVRALVLASSGDNQSTADGRRWVWITKTVYLKAGQRVGVTFTDNLDLESQLAQVEPAGLR